MGIILLGIWIIIVPYLGIPDSWRTLLIALSGIAIAVLGLLLRGETLSRGQRGSNSRPFVERIHSSPQFSSSSQDEVVRE